ncbi:hypothetical protein AMATHDRAFT_47355 [Amanita thiersii Skay4041]|uniref:Uncharacterized protein n=1 Tax=Amanita thiersii Skay4041 TaxID=703135 RepID=A0A2A9NTU0_9AGAR|nr:hypothetical protein AMATHDRAFT_47355 [Amanita thiersii Skay4041]
MSTPLIVVSPPRLSPRSTRKRPASPSRDFDHRPSKLSRTSTQATASPVASSSMTPLKRSETYISLASFCTPPIAPPPPLPLPPVTTTTGPLATPSSSASSSSRASHSIPYKRTLKYYKEQRDRRNALLHSGQPLDSDPLFYLLTNAFSGFTQKPYQEQPQQVQPDPYPQQTVPSSSTSHLFRPKSLDSLLFAAANKQQFPAAPKRSKKQSTAPRLRPPFERVSSPLAPRPATPSTLYNMKPNPHPDFVRPIPLRAKQSPDLYKVAIKTRMRLSKDGQQLLALGPRLAWKLDAATRELEKIVAAENAQVQVTLPYPQPLPPQQRALPRPVLTSSRNLVRTPSIADLGPYIKPVSLPPVKDPADTLMEDLGKQFWLTLEKEDWEMVDVPS